MGGELDVVDAANSGALENMEDAADSGSLDD